MNKSIFLALTSALLIQVPVLAQTHESSSNQSHPKNIIFLIGDGMGPAYTTAYRYYIDNPETPTVERTIFDQLLVGNASTYSSNTGIAEHLHDEHLANQVRNTYVTDSSAAATALSSGIKTYNGAVAVDDYHRPTHTLMEQAKALNKHTGLVVTSQINHATPASFAAHNVHRGNYDEIADSYYDDKVNGKFVADLMLGGGTQYYQRQDRNIVNEFQQSGYHYISQFEQLKQLKQLPAMGLFAKKGLPHVIDSGENHLNNMVNHALPVLSENNDNGFFLLIEGSQIDWCGHSNDIACAMHEMHDFALTLETVKNYIDNHPNTLMVVTADHSTGGLTIGSNNEYVWYPAALKGVKGSLSALTTAATKAKKWKDFGEDYLGLALSKKEIKSLKKARRDGEEALYAAIAAIIDTHSNTGWTTDGHTAVDVQVFAYGKGAAHFAGSYDNTELPKKLFGLMESSPR